MAIVLGGAAIKAVSSEQTGKQVWLVRPVSSVVCKTGDGLEETVRMKKLRADRERPAHPHDPLRSAYVPKHQTETYVCKAVDSLQRMSAVHHFILLIITGGSQKQDSLSPFSSRSH